MTFLGPSLRRAQVRERPWARVALALPASLALNALLLLVLARSGAFEVGPVRQASRVALAPVSAERWAANRTVRPKSPGARSSEPFPMPRPPPKPPPEPEAERNAKGQVVDIARPADPKAPKDSRFLAEHDSTVEKETRSRHARPGYERTLPVPSAPGTETGPLPGQDGASDRSVPGAAGAVASAAPQATTQRAAPTRREGGAESARSSRVANASPPSAVPGHGGAPAPAAGAGEGGLRLKGSPDALRLPPGTLSRLAGGPAPDHLDAVEEGEGTWLNARGWKYASYFNRLKSEVADAWDPFTPYNERDPDGSFYAARERVTVCDVTLDDRGNLTNVEVAQSSGLEFLDLAAVKAFETAAPFPNPPRGVVDSNGEIRFLFTLTLDVREPSRVAVHVGPGVWPMMPNPPMRSR